jgi:glycolate oxidase iron-sulfur subunit
MAAKLGDRKAANIRGTGAQACLIGNVGCLMQIARHLKGLDPAIWCAHPVDALWASYSGEIPAEISSFVSR